MRGRITPGNGSVNGLQTVRVEYEVTGTSSVATGMIADNDNNTTLYFTDASVPWSRSEAKEESNHVFLTVMYNDVTVETLAAAIFRNGEVFQTNSVTADDINFTIEGFLDQ